MKMVILLVLLMIISSCSHSIDDNYNLLKGKWIGSCGKNKIELDFKSNDSVVIFYSHVNHHVSMRYKFISADTLVIGKDTAFLKHLSKNKLVLRPDSYYVEDVNVIFITDCFEKVE